METSRLSALLYAEIYGICSIVVALLLYWTLRVKTLSTAERWLRNVLIAFLLNFGANLLFTLVNSGLMAGAGGQAVPYALKTLYFITLYLGVFAWCGYAETEQRRPLYGSRRMRWLMGLLLALPVAAAIGNLWTRHLFDLAGGRYTRHVLYHISMVYLIVWSSVVSCRLLQQCRRESDPSRRAHLRLSASFPLCILAAWLLSFVGESIPVICVSVMVELLCLYVGTSNQQISKDKLTQVNNRQNLMAFLNYKLRNHAGGLFLMMIDVDDFKNINNTWGHLEGDNALVKMAAALKHCCGPIQKRPYIARYGGDEFIVVMEGEEREAEALRQSIHDYLRNSATAGEPYELRASIGLSQWQPGQEAKELIAAADRQMYEVKHRHHQGK